MHPNLIGLENAKHMGYKLGLSPVMANFIGLKPNGKIKFLSIKWSTFGNH